MRNTLLCGFTLALAACGSAPAPAPASTPAPAPASTGAPASVVNPADIPTVVGHRNDAPEISRSVGETGGVVLFWPRVSPPTLAAELHPLAGQLQARLRGLVEQALPGIAIDVRPEPERVCPKVGCKAMTVGVALSGIGNGRCVAVALLAPAGPSPTRLVPWGGDLKLRATEVPFREPPEPQIAVQDWPDCRTIDFVAHGDASVQAAIAEVHAAQAR